jgi:hypothetical protein
MRRYAKLDMKTKCLGIRLAGFQTMTDQIGSAVTACQDCPRPRWQKGMLIGRLGSGLARL